jgi:hypothetical protein
MRRWATMTAFSFEQPYWRLPNVAAARYICRLRADKGPYEGNLRCRPHVKNKRYPYLPILPRERRVCYNCGSATTGYHVETLEHMALVCSHKDMVELRNKTRQAMVRLLTDAVSHLKVSRRAPDVMHNDTAFMTVLLQCQRLGPVHHQPAGTEIWDMPLDAPVATETAACVHAVSNMWIDATRHYGPLPADALSGRAVVEAAADWAASICALHRRLSKENEDYQCRAREGGIRASSRVTAGASPASAARATAKKRAKPMTSMHGLKQRAAVLRVRANKGVPRPPKPSRRTGLSHRRIVMASVARRPPLTAAEHAVLAAHPHVALELVRPAMPPVVHVAMAVAAPVVTQQVQLSRAGRPYHPSRRLEV